MADLPEGYTIQPRQPAKPAQLPEGYSIQQTKTPLDDNPNMSAGDFMKFVGRNALRPWVELGVAMGAGKGEIPPEKTARAQSAGSMISGAASPLNFLMPGIGPGRAVLSGSLAGLGGQVASRLSDNPTAPAIGGAVGGAMGGKVGGAIGLAAMMPHTLHHLASAPVRNAMFNVARSWAGSLNPNVVARNIKAGIPNAIERSVMRAGTGELSQEGQQGKGEYGDMHRQ